MGTHNGNGAARQSRRRRSFIPNLSATDRAIIAAGLVESGGWSVKDAAERCRVNEAYVAKVRRLSEVDIFRLQCGAISLSQLCNGHRPKPTLADRLANATPSERAEAAARLGPAVIWDEMISPLIDEERASQVQAA